MSIVNVSDKLGNISNWDSVDIVLVINDFYKESQKYSFIGARLPYCGYSINIGEKINIERIHWHSPPNNYIIYYNTNGGRSNYTYIPDMDARLRDLKIKKILNEIK